MVPFTVTTASPRSRQPLSNAIFSSGIASVVPRQMPAQAAMLVAKASP